MEAELVFCQSWGSASITDHTSRRFTGEFRSSTAQWRTQGTSCWAADRDEEEGKWRRKDDEGRAVKTERPVRTDWRDEIRFPCGVFNSTVTRLVSPSEMERPCNSLAPRCLSVCLYPVLVQLLLCCVCSEQRTSSIWLQLTWPYCEIAGCIGLMGEGVKVVAFIGAPTARPSGVGGHQPNPLVFHLSTAICAKSFSEGKLVTSRTVFKFCLKVPCTRPSTPPLDLKESDPRALPRALTCLLLSQAQVTLEPFTDCSHNYANSFRFYIIFNFRKKSKHDIVV